MKKQRENWTEKKKIRGKSRTQEKMWERNKK